MRITAKIGTMRKMVDWVIYPISDDGTITVQSDRYIGRFDSSTCRGILSMRCPGHPTFTNPAILRTAKPYTFPREFVIACTEQSPVAGDEIGPGVTWGGITNATWIGGAS